MICPLSTIEEVFKTEKGAFYQCSRKNCFWLEFMNRTTSFTVSDFFTFKKRIDSIDVIEMLKDTSRKSDFEIVMPFRSERCFLLTVQDIIDLQELLAGAKFMLELNGQLKTILRRNVLAVH